MKSKTTIVSNVTDYDIPLFRLKDTLKLVGALSITCVLGPLLQEIFQMDFRWVTLWGNGLFVPYIIIHNNFKEKSKKMKIGMFIFFGLTLFLLTYLWLFMKIFA